jgi:GGDEF domain-containing protein
MKSSRSFKTDSLKDHTVTVGCSIGGGRLPTDSDHPIEAMHLADEAPYASKEKKGLGTFYENNNRGFKSPTIKDGNL